MKMLPKSLAVMFLAGSLLAACGGVGDEGADEGLPPDPAFGLETQDGKADSLTVRPGSEEAEIVLAFVNQPLSSDVAGAEFVRLLDSGLHRRAAQNIGAFRAGPDGHYDTADDAEFATLRDVDAIKWVGPVALAQLHDLALANGYGAPSGGVRCSDHIEMDSGRFVFETNADLIEMEESGCSILDTDVTIDLRGRYLPPSARTLKAFHEVTEVRGELRILVDPAAIDAVDFPKLEKADRLEIRNSDVDRVVPADFSSLEDVEEIELAGIDGADFRSLETVGAISIARGTPTTENFASLREAGGITFRYLDNRPSVALEFPELEQVSGLILLGDARTRLDGEFPNLEVVSMVQFTRFDMSGTRFPSLVEVDRIKTRYTHHSYAPFVALERVRDLQSADDFGPHVGIATLEEVDTLDFYNGEVGTFGGFENLKTARTIEIMHDCSTDVTYWGAPAPGEFDAFKSLERVEVLDLEARNCEVDGFTSLLDVEDSMKIRRQHSIEGFDSLEYVGGGVELSELSPGDDLPSLMYVGGSFVAASEEDFEGFNQLETVEGHLRIDNSWSRIKGLTSLSGLGGDLLVSSRTRRSDVDRLLGQLTVFSGNVHFVD